MIITRTPYRISFFGGGTDFPDYYREHGGSVLSTTINKYSHLLCRNLPPYFDHKYRIRYFQTERVNTLDEIQHPSARECLRFCNHVPGVEILHSGDIPAMSGIGSSSSFTVGLLLALAGLQGRMVTKRQLALDAVHVEQHRIGENVGSQDQFAAAFGGLNRIDFGPGDEVVVSPVFTKPEVRTGLQRNLLFVFSGTSRFSSEIQQSMKQNLSRNTRNLRHMAAMVDEAQSLLSAGSERHLDDFGRLLHEAWSIKKNLSSKISTSALDSIYERAIRAGALGGKVCGAGGGGFVMFYIPPDSQTAVRTALADLLFVPIQMEELGAHVIFYSYAAINGSGEQTWV